MSLSKPFLDEFLESPIKTRAPEVIEAQRWSTKSDVWSFGIVIYQMITYGEEPYPDMDDAELMNSVLTTYQVPCPAGKNFTYADKKLMKIIQCCWLKDPFRRPDFQYLTDFFHGFFAKQGAQNLVGYLNHPKYTNAIKGNGPVSGITVCKDELFLTRSDSINIETFNISTMRRGKPIPANEKRSKFNPLKRLRSRGSVHGMKPLPAGLKDITCCTKTFCLYVSDWSESRIYRINMETREMSLSWQVETAPPSGLSVTKDGNLLVCCTSECKIFEYTSEGEVVHEINFGSNGEGPHHAVQVVTGLILVCHGKIDKNHPSEGVSLIDMYGKIAAGTNSIEIQNPSHLAVDSRLNVLIAEKGRNRIILTRHNLATHRVLLTSEQGIQTPTRIHLNETTGQLYVGLQDGTLLIYAAKSDSSNGDPEDNGSAQDDYYFSPDIQVYEELP